MKFFSHDAPEFRDVPTQKLREVQRTEEIRDAAFEHKPIGFFKDAAIRFCKSRISMAALVGILIVLLFAIFGPGMNEHGFNEQNPDLINMPAKVPALTKLGILNGGRWLQNRRVDSLDNTDKYPEGCILAKKNFKTIKGVEVCDVKVDYYMYKGLGDEFCFWMGSDYLGRDLWTRMWRGARISLLIAFLSVACNITIGLIYGAIAGYYGGKADMIMMRIAEIVGAFPEVVVVTLFILFFGTGLLSIVLALVVQNWIGTAKMIRSQFYRYKGSEYVLAARTLGEPDRSLIFRYIMPNSIGPIITRAMIAIPGAIFTESFLAYIGLGIRAPECSIGVLLSQGQQVMMQFPVQVFFPAAVISILMISFNMLANGLRDAFDPTQRGA